jgi:kynurenine formamidase
VLIDLSHVIHDGLTTYPGLRAPRICDYLSREASRERYAPGTTFAGLPLAGAAVVIHTGWSRHFGTPAYGTNAPYLTRAAGEALIEARAAFVAIDSLNVDDTADGARPVHTLLLGAGIPIGEHFTNLAALPERGARLHAAPVKVRAMGTFPVRAYAVV